MDRSRGGVSRRTWLAGTAASLAVLGSGRPAGAAATSVALVLPGSIGDGGWNQYAYDGLEVIRAQGFKTAFTENVAQAKIPEIVRGYADDGYDLIYGHGFQFGSLFVEIASDYPGQKFFATTDPPGDQVPPNVMYFGWRYYDIAYAAGALAAMMSDKKKAVGAVGGGDNPIQRGMNKTFIGAAERTEPGLKGLGIVTGDYNDAAKGRAAAATLIGNGADVIWHTADITGLGVVQGAAAAKVKIIGSFSDQTKLAPDYIGTNLLADNKAVLIEVAKMVADGSFNGGTTWTPPLDLTWKPVYGTAVYNPRVIPEPTWNRFMALWADIRAGKVDTAEFARAG
jgi:basic membrane protein A